MAFPSSSTECLILSGLAIRGDATSHSHPDYNVVQVMPGGYPLISYIQVSTGFNLDARRYLTATAALRHNQTKWLYGP